LHSVDDEIGFATHRFGVIAHLSTDVHDPRREQYQRRGDETGERRRAHQRRIALAGRDKRDERALDETDLRKPERNRRQDPWITASAIDANPIGGDVVEGAKSDPGVPNPDPDVTVFLSINDTYKPFIDV
jgi:hypothetical protein